MDDAIGCLFLKYRMKKKSPRWYVLFEIIKFKKMKEQKQER